MIVYVESNFPLELALLQQDADTAENILQLAETTDVELAFPASAIYEPFSKLTYQGLDRQRIITSLISLAKEANQPVFHQGVVQALSPILTTSRQAEKDEMDRLEAVVTRLLNAGRSIETDPSIFAQALVYRGRHGFSTQDAVIYACVIADLERQKSAGNNKEVKCFLSRDKAAFRASAITAELRIYNCRYIPTFSDGLSFIQSRI